MINTYVAKCVHSYNIRISSPFVRADQHLISFSQWEPAATTLNQFVLASAHTFSLIKLNIMNFWIHTQLNSVGSFPNSSIPKPRFSSDFREALNNWQKSQNWDITFCNRSISILHPINWVHAVFHIGIKFQKGKSSILRVSKFNFFKNSITFGFV